MLMKRMHSCFFISVMMFVLNACTVPIHKELINNDVKQLRAEAYRHFEKKHFGLALSKINQALDQAKYLPGNAVQTIESYDDAGLYYFMIDDFERSVHHQAIAVLLALDNKKLTTMRKVYMQRLGWAFAKYLPGDNFEVIRDNPLLLLEREELKVKADPAIRNVFYHKLFVPEYLRKYEYQLQSRWVL